MIFVDTSVWVQFLRGKDSDLVTEVRRILDEDSVAIAAPVWVELLSGATKAELPRLRRVFSALPRYYPDQASWERIDRWISEGASRGQRFGSLDLLIASIAAGSQAALWSLDRDFGRMAALKWVRLHACLRL